MTTVPAAGDAELVERLCERLDLDEAAGFTHCCDCAPATFAELRLLAARLAAANALSEDRLRAEKAWRAKAEAANARLAEAEREATEDRRLVGDLRARIATLTEAIEKVLPASDAHSTKSSRRAHVILRAALQGEESRT